MAAGAVYFLVVHPNRRRLTQKLRIMTGSRGGSNRKERIMRAHRVVAIAAVIGLLAPVAAFPQALTNLSSLRVGYNTRKATVRPEGELKTQIDAVDRDLAEATRLGKTAEIRRLLAKGTTLLAGRPWTDAADYTNSLVIRTDRVVVDSSKPYYVRLEQIYSPAIQLERPLKAHADLRQRPSGPPAAGGTPPPPAIVKDLGTTDGVGRDLRDSPFSMDLDLQGVADGTYQLVVDVSDESRALGTAALLISVRKGLDETITKLEADAKRAPDGLRADILFPVDRMRAVNRGQIELRTFDPDKDFPTAETVAAAAKSGKNPFATKTGDFKRHYLLESANEIMPYHMYVPTTYNGSRAYPLIIALHGLGGTEDAFFTGYESKVPGLAEQHGFIVAAPLGYRVDGSYGWGLGNPPADPATRRMQERSEQDVMKVLELVRQQYKIDANRIYLMGHSMGGIGTWKIAPKSPDIWAAIAPISGSGTAATLERIRTIPEIVVHGDDDRTVSVQGSRTMVAKLKELGTEVKYIEVPGGSHSGVVAPNLANIFDFFDTHKKAAKTTSQ
jgi:dienelactone hydrolase